jgi:hypothetical protein
VAKSVIRACPRLHVLNKNNIAATSTIKSLMHAVATFIGITATQANSMTEATTLATSSTTSPNTTIYYNSKNICDNKKT